MKRTTLYILLTLIYIPVFSQSFSMDSLRNLIDKASTDTSRIRLSIELANELTFNDIIESKKIIDDCIAKSREIGYKTGIAEATYIKAVSYAMESRFETCLKYMIESSILFQQIGNINGYAKCQGGMGNINYLTGNFTKAQSYYEDALRIYKKENNDIGMANSLSNLGLICYCLHNFEKALEYQFDGLKLEEKHENNRGIALSHILISSIYLNLKSFSEAKKHAFKSIQYSKSIADSNAISEGMLRLADCYRLTNQYDSAQFYLNETIRICQKNRDLHQLSYALNVQTNLYDSLGYIHKAFQTQKRLIVVKDSLLNNENTAKLIEMQAKFESEKNEKERLLLLSENFKQEIALWGLLVFIVFICIITIQIFLSRKKINQSHNNLLILHQEVNQQKEEIETQTENLIDANISINLQKNQLEGIYQKITDSIVYASFIQSAMLPSSEILNSFSSENFILYKPRDFVSGDFYWFKEKEGNFVIAVADCTGHGVPGALLSMMGISFLNDIIANSKFLHTSLILENLRQNVKHALGQFSIDNLRREGIEIGIIIYNPIKKTLSYSGAYLSLWLCRNGSIKEYKSDRMSIGISLKEKPFSHIEIDIHKDDIIYMFTDGYSDQLSGQTRKKFLRRNLIQEFAMVSLLPLSEQMAHLEKKHQAWKGDKTEQIDDILVLGIKF